MTTRAASHRNASRFHRCLLITLGMLLGCCLAISAGEVRLKNGTVLQGRPAKLFSLAKPFNPTNAPTDHFPVVMVQTGGSTPWQRYYVPYRQVPDAGLVMDAELPRQDEFSVFHLKGSRSFIVKNVGSITQSAPFDQNGRRWVTLQTEREPLNVTQGITRLTPTHVDISSLNYQWDFSVALNQLPESTVLEILRNPVVCKPDNPQDRMARARFCIQAGWYPVAEEELTSIARDFTDLTAQVDEIRQELRQLFARDVLRELNRRKEAGQFQLAEESARKIPPDLGAGIAREVQRFLGELQQTRDTVEKVRSLVAELQAKLPAGDLTRNVAAMRSALNEELGPHGLSRMLPFLQAETDAQLTAEEKLGLAYSGWVLGAEGADTDLPRAHRLWDARVWVTEYLRADNPVVRAELYGQLNALEGVSPNTIRQLLQHLPPARESEGIPTGTPYRIEVPGGHAPGVNVSYWVVLPPEYSPQHRYPAVVALHPGANAIESTAQWWAGTEDHPGWAQRRGTIVIVPEYLPEAAKEYTGSPAAHAVVIESLRDARLRFAIDSDRVFLAGHGLGGDAAFDIGITHPDEFAGVIPISFQCNDYAFLTRDNTPQTAWYLIRGELTSDANSYTMRFFDDVAKKHGPRLDIIYCQYLGRGAERYGDELPKLFDWMELHRRPGAPKEFDYTCLRQTDDRLHWVTMLNLPRNYILPAPATDRTGIKPMELTARVSDGNTLYVKSQATGCLLRLSDEIVNFDKRVTIHVNSKRKYHDFVKAELSTMLDDYRHHGDRRRIAQVVLQF